eukprot:jgi/Psemu1/58880/gm1.58880_g
MFKGMMARFMTEVPTLDKTMNRCHEEVVGEESKNTVYVKAYNHAQNLNLWGEVPPNIINNENLISLSKQTPMSTAILYSWSESGNRSNNIAKGTLLTLVTARRMYFEEYPNALEERQETCEGNKLLLSMFYKLHPAAVNQNFYV